MAEIERKFLVKEMPRAESGSTAIEQGYLALDQDTEVRLRRAGDELFLTAKGGHGEVREEVEVPIEPEAFAALWPLTAGQRLHKTRHEIPWNGLTVEIDVYGGGNRGLIVAEVEFETVEAAHRFEPPAWLGRDVSGETAYSNPNLARE